MDIQTVPLDQLHIDPSNARKHGDRNLDAIKASLVRFGQQHPIIATEDGVVIAGNGRLEAMRSLGWESCAVVRTDLEGVDIPAFAIADNRTADLAKWDEDALGKTLQSLRDEDGFDHLVTGFDDDEINKIIDGLTPPEEPESPNDVPHGVRVSIVCEDDEFETIRETIEEWSEVDGIEIDIS